jgi:hypothetical protein
MQRSAINAAAAQLAARDASPFAHVGLTHLVDDMIDGYVCWREECRSVDTSYQNWSHAGREDRQLAFSAYIAALDREECAAATYRSLAERIPLT